MSPYPEKVWDDGTPPLSPSTEPLAPSEIAQLRAILETVGTTPLDANALNDLETRISDYFDQTTQWVSIDDPVYAPGDPTDWGPSINAAIADAAASVIFRRGGVLFSGKTYPVKTTINMSRTGMRLKGAGMRSGTVFDWTGTAAIAVDMRSAQSCVIDSLNVTSSVIGSYTLIDMSRPSTGTSDTSMNKLTRVRLSMPQSASPDNQAVGVWLQGSYGNEIDPLCWITGGMVGVDGIRASVADNQYVNATLIGGTYGMQRVASLRNLSSDASNGNVVSATFEPLIDGSAGAADATTSAGHLQTPDVPGGTLNFFGCWAGDANAVGFWIVTNGGVVSIDGGSYFTKGHAVVKTTTALAIVNILPGNRFHNMANIVDSSTLVGGNSVCEMHYYAGNFVTSVTTLLPGPFADNSTVDVLTGFGSRDAYGMSITADKGGPTQLRIGNAGGARPTIFWGSAEATSVAKEDAAEGLFTNQQFRSSRGIGTRAKVGRVTDADFDVVTDGLIAISTQAPYEFGFRANGDWRWMGSGIFKRRIPKLVVPAVLDSPFVSAVFAPGTDVLWLVRVVLPENGNIHDLSVYVGTASGNLRGCVFDTGDATGATTRTLRWSGSSIAAVAGWLNLGDLNLSSIAGQQVDFGVMADNNTVTLGCRDSIGSSLWLPNTFDVAPGGAKPYLAASVLQGSFAVPAAVDETTLVSVTHAPVIIARM